MTQISPLIEPAELSSLLGTVKILDASYGVPDPQGSFARAHIEGAQFFDIDDIADHTAAYPHTLPLPDAFGAAVGRLGIGNDEAVVVYDQRGISFAAARAWWMFRVMGHANVRVLNGGLQAWQMAGLPVISGAPDTPAAKNFTAEFRPDLYRSFEQMEDNTTDTIVDARGAPRFNAQMRTMDGDAVPAHIPGSSNLPFDTLLDPVGRMKPVDEIAGPLLARIAPGSPLVATCGSGVTACVLALGFCAAGYPDVAVYDGSWTEWSDRQNLRG